MRLTQLRDLIATIDSGSIRGAARALQVTPPVLMRNIRDLEKELGQKLLERTPHGVAPTPAGKAFLARARIVQNELQMIKEESAQLLGSAGTLTFGASSPANVILPGALAAFRNQYPAATVRIVNGLNPTLLPMLREGRIEFAVCARGTLKDKRIKSQPLFRNESAIVGRPGHPLSKAKTLEELVDADWLVGSAPGDSADLPWTRTFKLFEENGLPPPRSIVYCQGTTSQALLIQTNMLGITQRSNLYGNLIQPLQIKARMPASFSFTTHLLLRTDSPLTPAATAMVAAVKAEARKLAFANKL